MFTPSILVVDFSTKPISARGAPRLDKRFSNKSSPSVCAEKRIEKIKIIFFIIKILTLLLTHYLLYHIITTYSHQI